MSFGENVRAVRKDRGLSQEELAEQLQVSRQAVSKWEQDEGYPEMEKLILLSEKLNVSLDALVSGGDGPIKREGESPAPRRLLIQAQDGRAVVSCYKVLASSKFRGKKDEPQYALFGVDGSTFWGENSTFLGWYADQRDIKREMDAIAAAIKNGEAFYHLQYAANVKRHWMRVKLERGNPIPPGES